MKHKHERWLSKLKLGEAPYRRCSVAVNTEGGNHLDLLGEEVSVVSNWRSW
jgi:hypothetical protein